MALEELSTYETPQEQLANFLREVRDSLKNLQGRGALANTTIEDARHFMNTFDGFKEKLNLDANEVKWALQGILDLRIELMRELSKLERGHEYERLNLYHAFLRHLSVTLKQVEKDIGEDVSDAPTGR